MYFIKMALYMDTSFYFKIINLNLLEYSGRKLGLKPLLNVIWMFNLYKRDYSPKEPLKLKSFLKTIKRLKLHF